MTKFWRVLAKLTGSGDDQKQTGNEVNGRFVHLVGSHGCSSFVFYASTKRPRLGYCCCLRIVFCLVSNGSMIRFDLGFISRDSQASPNMTGPNECANWMTLYSGGGGGCLPLRDE